MKKLLPKTANNPYGFTLVELMVVISIIAILAIIGITVFQNVQKNARDSRRKADIDSIADAMETNYSETTGAYIALAANMFSQGSVPTDPLGAVAGNNCSSNVCRYCYRPNAATNICAATAGALGAADSLVTIGNPIAGPIYEVCADLEGTNTAYCRNSQR